MRNSEKVIRKAWSLQQFGEIGALKFGEIGVPLSDDILGVSSIRGYSAKLRRRALSATKIMY